MPYPAFKKMAEQTGLTTKEVKEKWRQAKGVAYENFNNEIDDFYPYAIRIWERMIGLDKVEAAIIKRQRKVVYKNVLDLPGLWLLNTQAKGQASSAVRAAAYQAKSKSLFIDYNSKNLDENWYWYKNVPLKVWIDFTDAPSKGKFLATKVRKKYLAEKV